MKLSTEENRIIPIVLALSLLVIILTTGGCTGSGLHPEQTWAVILEQNFYPPGYTPLDVKYENSNSILRTLKAAGLDDTHILSIPEGVSRLRINEAVAWLQERADGNDAVIFYIFSHGPYLGDDVEFTSWFPGLWEQIETRDKLLIVDTCFSESYLEPLMNMEDDPGFLIGSSGTDEIAWCGLEKEGLPVIGSSWLYFFLEAAGDPGSDINGDGYIALDEVFHSSVEPLQDYMMNTVYAVPEFLEGIHQYGIYPEDMDGYPNPVFYTRRETPLLLYKL